MLHNVGEMSGCLQNFVEVSIQYVILRRDVHRVLSGLRKIVDDCPPGSVNFPNMKRFQKKPNQGSRAEMWDRSLSYAGSLM